MHCVSITKTNRLMLFTGTIDVYCENKILSGASKAHRQTDRQHSKNHFFVFRDVKMCKSVSIPRSIVLHNDNTLSYYVGPYEKVKIITSLNSINKLVFVMKQSFLRGTN
jgi:hypothetical protein